MKISHFPGPYIGGNPATCHYIYVIANFRKPNAMHSWFLPASTNLHCYGCLKLKPVFVRLSFALSHPLADSIDVKQRDKTAVETANNER